MTTQPQVTTGDDDLNWVHEHMNELGEFSGQWIAVIACKIVAAGATVDEVLDKVGEQGLTDPFVTQIPDDVNRVVYLIA